MSSEKACPPTEVDQLFLKLFSTLGADIIETTEKAAKAILDTSAQFLDKGAHDAVAKFYKLYSNSTELEKTKEAINEDIDSMIESVRNNEEIKETEETKSTRLSLAGIQKELETIITLNVGIKDKLVPVLSSMQFEDMVRHRIQNVCNGWDTLINADDEAFNDLSILDVLKEHTTSNAERSLFYELVLQKEMPNNELVDQWVDFEMDGAA